PVFWKSQPVISSASGARRLGSGLQLRTGMANLRARNRRQAARSRAINRGQQLTQSGQQIGGAEGFLKEATDAQAGTANGCLLLAVAAHEQDRQGAIVLAHLL